MFQALVAAAGRAASLIKPVKNCHQYGNTKTRAAQES
jgi:hypothetical protein